MLLWIGVTAGDDEQSDFYCEPDYPCTGGLMAASMIAGARSRWKAERCEDWSDSHLAWLHRDVCSQISPSLRNSYKTRCKILACITTVLCFVDFDCGYQYRRILRNPTNLAG